MDVYFLGGRAGASLAILLMFVKKQVN